MSIEIVPPEAEAYLDWTALGDAFLAGHRLPRAEVADSVSLSWRGYDAVARGLDRRAGFAR